MTEKEIEASKAINTAVNFLKNNPLKGVIIIAMSEDENMNCIVGSEQDLILMLVNARDELKTFDSAMYHQHKFNEQRKK